MGADVDMREERRERERERLEAYRGVRIEWHQHPSMHHVSARRQRTLHVYDCPHDARQPARLAHARLMCVCL